jgi:hypothetical protein
MFHTYKPVRALSWLTLVTLLTSLVPSAASAGDADKKRAPPGVIIEPVKPRKERDESSVPDRDRERSTQPGPGCPSNDRKLELLV